MTPTAPTPTKFSQLKLAPELANAITKAGYTKPTPIQATAIPALLAGEDVVGQAQTGTGKTAAFALPMLMQVALKEREVQVLVLTPTRELAIQVATAFTTYGRQMKGLRVLSVYGGQEYNAQLGPLKSGVHVVVGTPGRIMDHMRRGTLSLSALKGVVLDEADEMLKMGFREDVEWILRHTPPHRQTALFSATMPRAVKAIARAHMNTYVEVEVKDHTAAADTIKQRAYRIRKSERIDALSRLLEAEDVNSMLCFVRRKITTMDVSEQLVKRGYSSIALHGDMAQSLREKTVNRFKGGMVQILVATEVAARGLDFQGVTHVVNFDLPEDPDIYVHRIGRTGRAGNTGISILFVTQKELGFLKRVERETKQPISLLPLPSIEVINERRISHFKRTLTKTIKSGNYRIYEKLLGDYAKASGTPIETIAAALAKMAEGNAPLLFKETSYEAMRAKREEGRRGKRERLRGEHSARALKELDPSPKEYGLRQRERREGTKEKRGAPEGTVAPSNSQKRGERVSNGPLPKGMERYAVPLGRQHGITPGELIGVISGTTGLHNLHIGRITIGEEHTLVDLPMGIPERFMVLLREATFEGKPLDLELVEKGQLPGRKGRGLQGRIRGKKRATKPKRRKR